jgi:predicted transcriptional regulator
MELTGGGGKLAAASSMKAERDRRELMFDLIKVLDKCRQLDA